MNDIILSQIPLPELVAAIREVVKEELSQKTPTQSMPGKPISERELCVYLGISLPTAIRWRQKGKIPFLRIGSVIRYNLNEVIDAIEKNKKK